jgi:hypothetical protein
MKKYLTIAALLFAVPAYAADMPVKAPPQNSPFLLYNGSGFYIGLGTTSAVDQASVNGSNLFASSLVDGNLNAAGQSVDLEVGYIWGNASVAGIAQWARVYASGSYQNITGGISVPGNDASVASRWSAMQGIDVGADLVAKILTATNLQVAFPSFTPQLPSNVAVATTPREYFGAFFDEFGVNGSVGLANGVEVATAPGIRTGYLWQTVDSTGKPNGGALDLGVAVAWPLKGMTFNDVFAAGHPIQTGAGIDLGTQYKAYIRYDF